MARGRVFQAKEVVVTFKSQGDRKDSVGPLLNPSPLGVLVFDFTVE